MFVFILLSLFTLIHFYAFWRVRSIPLLKNHCSGKLIVWTGIILWLCLVLGLLYGRGNSNFAAKILTIIGMNWLGILFFVSSSFLIIDVVTFFGLLFHRIVPQLRQFAFLVAVTLSLFAFVQAVRPPVVKEYDVYISSLPDEMIGKKIVALSDLHIGTLSGKKWLEARIAQVQEMQPDIILLLGDILEGHGGSQEELLPVLRRLSAPMGVWAVRGNHEHYGRNNKSMSILKNAGFHVLNNSWIELSPGMILAGVDDLTIMRRSGRNVNIMSKTLEKRPKGTTILLSHSPLEIDKAEKEGVNLMLCGHTHAGQIWPFRYFVQRFYPLIDGQYDINGMTVIVSRGAGTWGPKMRLWRRGEISCITLHN